MTRCLGTDIHHVTSNLHLLEGIYPFTITHRFWKMSLNPPQAMTAPFLSCEQTEPVKQWNVLSSTWMLTNTFLPGFPVWHDLHGASHARLETTDGVLDKHVTTVSQYHSEGIYRRLV